MERIHKYAVNLIDKGQENYLEIHILLLRHGEKISVKVYQGQSVSVKSNCHC